MIELEFTNVVDLNLVEQALVRFVAKKRLEANRKVGAKATLYGNGGRDPLQREINYYGAEVAFCRLHNMYPDTDIAAFNNADCVNADGKFVDVKSTELENGRLLVKCKKWEHPPDYFALMVGTFPHYYFSGMIKASEMLVEWRIDRSLPYPAYVAEQSELTQAGFPQ